MSRTFLAGDGSDSTAAVKTYLLAHRELAFADLILIGEPEDPLATWLTDWPSPLLWATMGTFIPASIPKRGTVSSKIGLSVATMEFQWAPKITAFGTSILTANPYQKVQNGFYDNMKFRLWRCVMPTPGDAMTLGACEYFGGRVSKSEVGRAQINFSINSFLEVANQKVPPNVIELGNTLSNYSGHVPVISDGETQLPQFVVVAPTTNNLVTATCLSPSAGKIYGNNKFQFGFIRFNPGSSLAGFYSIVASNQNFKSGTVHYNQFTLYAPFPWSPSPGDTFYASIKPPQTLADASAAFEYYGFPSVPQPEGAV